MCKLIENVENWTKIRYIHAMVYIIEFSSNNYKWLTDINQNPSTLEYKYFINRVTKNLKHCLFNGSVRKSLCYYVTHFVMTCIKIYQQEN